MRPTQEITLMISKFWQWLLSEFWMRSKGLCVSFLVFNPLTEVNGIAHSGVDKLHWHQSSWVLTKLQLKGFLMVNLRMKINISLVCLTLQANLFEVNKLWLGWVSHHNCRSTEMKKKNHNDFLSSGLDTYQCMCCHYSVVRHSKNTFWLSAKWSCALKSFLSGFLVLSEPEK